MGPLRLCWRIARSLFGGAHNEQIPRRLKPPRDGKAKRALFGTTGSRALTRIFAERRDGAAEAAPLRGASSDWRRASHSFPRINVGAPTWLVAQVSDYGGVPQVRPSVGLTWARKGSGGGPQLPAVGGSGTGKQATERSTDKAVVGGQLPVVRRRRADFPSPLPEACAQPSGAARKKMQVPRCARDDRREGTWLRHDWKSSPDTKQGMDGAAEAAC